MESLVIYLNGSMVFYPTDYNVLFQLIIFTHQSVRLSVGYHRLCPRAHLFIIYVNDIDSVCCGDTTLQLFADDARLYSNVVVNNTSVSLQLSLDRPAQWAKDWQLHININKCSVLPVKHTARSSVRYTLIIWCLKRDSVSVLCFMVS
jgi:hypothetical protein